MTFTLRVHESVRNNDGNVIGRRENPYLRLSNGGEIVQIQSGEFYGNGGGPIADKNVPGWVWEQIENLPPHVKREYKLEGLTRPEK
jgi:hypothetical protein